MKSRVEIVYNSKTNNVVGDLLKQLNGQCIFIILKVFILINK